MDSAHAAPDVLSDEHARAVAVEPKPPERAALAGDLSPAAVLRLQRSAGNRAVQALLRRQAAPARVASAPITRAPERKLQRGFWGKVWGGIKSAASAVGSGVVSGAKAVGGAVKTAAVAVGSAVKTGAEAVGKGVVTAAKAVGSAAEWVGEKAWKVMNAVGSFAWEKLKLLGTLAWSFISMLPERLWRLAIDGWEAIVGSVTWLMNGIKDAAGWAWDAVTGVFDWLKEGFSGALKWLGKGIEGGAQWAADFISDPSWSKLADGLVGSLSWLGEGVKGLGKWGLDGIVAAAKWGWEGLEGLGAHLWDAAKRGFWWAIPAVVHVLEAVGLNEALQLIWGFVFRMRELSDDEIKASKEVHPSGLIPYWKVRVDEDSFMITIGQYFAKKFNTRFSPAAITTMHVIQAPKNMRLPVAVHELTHVGQYEKVGAVYMIEALHGQQGEAYDYGDLQAKRRTGKHYKDFNREQQAQMVEDYYLWLHPSLIYNPATGTGDPAPKATKADLEPFIAEMRAGEF